MKVKFTLGTDENTYDNNSPSYDDSNNNNSTLSPDSVILICTIVPALMMVLITVAICVKCRYRDRHSAFHVAIQKQ